MKLSPKTTKPLSTSCHDHFRAALAMMGRDAVQLAGNQAYAEAEYLVSQISSPVVKSSAYARIAFLQARRGLDTIARRTLRSALECLPGTSLSAARVEAITNMALARAQSGDFDL